MDSDTLQELKGSGFDKGTISRFELYIGLLKRWNEAFNLVSKNDLVHVESRHLLDSVRLVSYMANEGSLIDIGSGAGFPGLPLAIATDLDVTLVERSQKKATFLNQVKLELGLNSLEVCAQDARQMKTKDFDVATIRAVDKPLAAWALAAPNLAVGGRMLLQTGKPVSLSFADGELEGTDRAEIGWVSVVRKMR